MTLCVCCNSCSILQSLRAEIYLDHMCQRCSTARRWRCVKTFTPNLWLFLACKLDFQSLIEWIDLSIVPSSPLRALFGTLLVLTVLCTTINVIRKKLNEFFHKKRTEGKNSRECLDVEKVEGKRQRKPLWDKFLTCFLAHENARIIFSTYLAPTSLPSIHGVRSISLSWIIMAHLFVYTVSNIGNLPRIFTFVGDWYMQPFNSAAIAVDSFYVLG